MPAPFGSSAIDLQGVVNELHQSNVALQQIITLLTNGILIQPNLQVFTVAGLPATGNGTGRLAWASNGRKPAEGVGAGTGVPIFWNPATSSWFSFLSGAVVTA